MNLTTGQRISTRGEDFLITNIITNSDGTHILQTEGISELVKGKRFTFDTKIDDDITPVNPVNTVFIADQDNGYRKTKLYIEVGIFLAEMLKRGKGKRIMVLALKSILGQFQQELWNRFAIPLVRLDSEGIARIKTQLPANKNPFDYYDKTIVSIDTLKNNAKFRHYIEKSHWDVIVIDECHTVANNSSQRGDLAQFLAGRCDSLILTSATPHNGKKESFANIINMIEPTAIPKNGNYSKADVEPYYVRRFKNDIDDATVRKNFQERKIVRLKTDLSSEELTFLSYQQGLKMKALSSLKEDGKAKDDFLFSVMIFKAFMSSPAAALQSIENRLAKVKELATSSDRYEDSIDILEEHQDLLKAILASNKDSKYAKLKATLEEMKWAGKKSHDRFVIFAERIATLKYLEENLKRDFDLADEVVQSFSGSDSDIEQQAIIEDFGKEDSKVRILLCSDAGSQGVNLHYYCHQMVNYDIPWSLITLEQRNGRIDRYGQKETPNIYYLVAHSEDENIKTDLHIINKLTEKEEEVYKTLGDAGSVMKLHDSHKEEALVISAIENKDENFIGDISKMDFSSLFTESENTAATITEHPMEEVTTVYRNDFSYYSELFKHLDGAGLISSRDYSIDNEDEYLELLNTKELDAILYDLPPESKPKVSEPFRLTLDKSKVQKAIDEARKKKGDWAAFQILYDLHPTIKYYMTKLEASVPKDQALAAKLSGKFEKGTAWY